MGRETRMVIPNWKHPEKEYHNHRLGRMEKGFQPLFDKDVETAFKDWYEGFITFFNEERDPEHYPKDQPYASFCKWNGTPPEPEFYRPKWKDGEATWIQLYETVSEGTPVSPPFATPEELIEYLVVNGDFWDQKRGEGRKYSRASAEAIVREGWAPSATIVSGVVYANADALTKLPVS